MRAIALLENPIREYAWGSRTAIAELLGAAPSRAPQAELWMGAHPSASSRVRIGDDRVSLLRLIEERPREILGDRVLERFGPRLPFLVKLLAAERPLSLQAHPDARQARQGYARENAAGLPLDAEARCYRDASHKPELICALRPFAALRGFRSRDEIRASLERLGSPGVAAAFADLADPDEARGLASVLEGLLVLSRDACRRLVGEARAAARSRGPGDPALAWLGRLAEEHPDDAGALAPLFLNLVELAPGEAMYLPAGELHSYLGGFGVEVMANSDNVLRGGLTKKHVDVAELLRVLRFRAEAPRVLRPGAGDVCRYETPAEEFELARLRVREGSPQEVADERGVEILLCAEGALRVGARGSNAAALASGASCLVPAAAGAYRVEGAGLLFRVSVPP